MAEKNRNVPGFHWLVAIGLLSAAILLGHSVAKGSTGTTGVVVEGAEVCFAQAITEGSTTVLHLWQSLINDMEAAADGGPALSDADLHTAYYLYSNNYCHTVNKAYMIFVLEEKDEYVLVNFDEQYDFQTPPFIVFRKDVRVDGEI